MMGVNIKRRLKTLVIVSVCEKICNESMISVVDGIGHRTPWRDLMWAGSQAGLIWYTHSSIAETLKGRPGDRELIISSAPESCTQVSVNLGCTYSRDLRLSSQFNCDCWKVINHLAILLVHWFVHYSLVTATDI